MFQGLHINFLFVDSHKNYAQKSLHISQKKIVKKAPVSALFLNIFQVEFGCFGHRPGWCSTLQQEQHTTENARLKQLLDRRLTNN